MTHMTQKPGEWNNLPSKISFRRKIEDYSVSPH